MAANAAQARRVGGMPGLVIETGTIVFSGNYVAGGETLSLPRPAGVQRGPTIVMVDGISGYKYEYNPLNGKILVRQSAAAGAAFAELAAAAYPAGVTGDTVTYMAFFTPRVAG